MLLRRAAGLRCTQSSGVIRRAGRHSHGLSEPTSSLSLFCLSWMNRANKDHVGCPFPQVWRTDGRWAGRGSSGAHGPQALFLHYVPQLTQVGLGDGVIRFQFKCSEVIGFSLLQLSVEVEDRPQVHQGSRILKPKISHFRTQKSSLKLCSKVTLLVSRTPSMLLRHRFSYYKHSESAAKT